MSVVEAALDFETDRIDRATVRPTRVHWYAAWTNSHCEQLVHDQLHAKGFEPFLPKVEVWSRRRGGRRLVSTPLFPGYVFLHHPVMSKVDYIEVCKARGLVRVLGERWDRLETIPDDEVDSIRRVLEAHVPMMPHPYLRDGERVRIVRGPLTDVEGLLIRTKPNKGLVVVRVTLLQRSVAVEVDCTAVAAA
jgi:transcription termination/antitermination protein NusG